MLGYETLMGAIDKAAMQKTLTGGAAARTKRILLRATQRVATRRAVVIDNAIAEAFRHRHILQVPKAHYCKQLVFSITMFGLNKCQKSGFSAGTLAKHDLPLEPLRTIQTKSASSCDNDTKKF